MLGRAVTRAAGEGALALTRAELDVTDAGAVRDALAGAGTVINCAAWTDVDGAEEHPEEALRVNRDGARNVAEAAERVLYVSTDYVFDGRRAPAARAWRRAEPGVGLRTLEARGRARDRGGQPAALHRPHGVAVRPRRVQLRRHDPPAGLRA